jgi:hypothetical protein
MQKYVVTKKTVKTCSWCLRPLSKIKYFSNIVTVLLVEETGVSGYKHRPVASN